MVSFISFIFCCCLRLRNRGVMHENERSDENKMEVYSEGILIEGILLERILSKRILANVTLGVLIGPAGQ